jgi:hypothetical protein
LASLLGAAARLAVLRRPGMRLAPAGMGVLALAILPWLLLGLGLDYALVEAPRVFNPWALGDRCLPFLLALLGAGLLAAILRRQAVAPPLAAVLLLALLPATLLWTWLGEREWLDGGLYAVAIGYLLVFTVQLVRWGAAGASPLRHLLAMLCGYTLLLGSVFGLPTSPWWWPDYGDELAEETTETPPAFSGEQLWNAQPQRLQDAIAALAPQRPGHVDLYVLGVAGDGDEAVFRNEVNYLRQLSAQRLDADGRMLSLVNHPRSIDDTPIASVTNLRAALRGIGERMDRDEDILLLFLTSHGSEEHAFSLNLGELPLDQLDPATLRAALDDAGIRWRVLVVSACYSGGFIDALRAPESLVITAARADRPSFGCGVQSEITWFGEAFLAEALNTTSDFIAAFDQARIAIRQREREEDERPSHPQLVAGAAIGDQLARWRAQLPSDSPRVPFVPAP